MAKRQVNAYIDDKAHKIIEKYQFELKEKLNKFVRKDEALELLIFEFGKVHFQNQ